LRPAELIERTFEAIDGARRAIVHLYNSTSVVQRRVVFGLGRQGITDLAVGATAMCRRLAAATATEIIFEYSAESFQTTPSSTSLWRSARQSCPSGSRRARRR
jgi:2-isopropylmalate synthase